LWFLRWCPLGREHGLPAVDNDLLVDAGLNVSVLEALPGGDTGLVDVHLKKPDTAMILLIAGITAEADAACVAHPQSWRFLLLFSF
jgi:hypothetical protein